jgi:hypothetical protein
MTGSVVSVGAQYIRLGLMLLATKVGERASDEKVIKPDAAGRSH